MLFFSGFCSIVKLEASTVVKDFQWLEHVPNLADVMELQILVVVDEKFPGRTVLVLSELVVVC